MSPNVGLFFVLAVALIMNPQATPGDSDGPGPTPGSDPTLAVLNARVWTGNLDQPLAEALVVSGERITFVGSNEEARALINDGVRIIEAEGRFVTPGFIDSHVHFLAGGARLSSVQLRDADSPNEFVRRIAAFAKTIPPGTWITGGDWDHTLWGGDLPERSWIDSATADHPVWVNRLDGHMALANSAALELAGVEANQSDVEGGEIVRDDSGIPTGILKDNAMDLVSNVIPEKSPEQLIRALESASSYVARQGITSVHDVAWVPPDLFRTAQKNGVIRTRIYTCAPLSRATRLAAHVEEHGEGDSWWRTGCVKAYMDGSLGSRTAAFFEPFEDTGEERGLLLDSEENLERMMRHADSLGLQLAIHAIGDRAIHILLNIFERIIEDGGHRERRLRMEHAQHIAPHDISRFAELQVIASMQPYHAIDDGRWAEGLIGTERAKTTYAFRSLLDAGVRLAFGSDWYVAPPTPLDGIYAAVTRRTLDGEHPGGWVPEQKISVEEALRAYTVDAAYASFEENQKGSLEVGKLADFVIIDRDLTAIDPVEIREAKIVMTVVAGEVVYRWSG